MRAARVECGRAQGVVGDQGGGGLCGAGRAVGWAARRKRLAVRRPGPPARPEHPLPPLGQGAPAREQRHLARQSDPDLGLERLSGRRVPLPGLPLRRPRRPRPVARSGRPPHRGRQLLSPERHLHLPDRPGLRQQRRRPGRAPSQVAPHRHRLPDHPEHAQGPLFDRDHDRDRQLPAAPRLSPRGQRGGARGALPDGPRLACGPRACQQLSDDHTGAPGVDQRADGARSRCSYPTAPGTPPSARCAWPPAWGYGTR